MMRQRLKRQSVLTIFRRGHSSLSFFNPTFNSRIEKVFFSGKYFKSIFGLKHSTLMIMIAPNSYARREVKKGKVKVEHGGIRGKEEGNADYGGMVQPSQQHVAPCIKELEW